jgi:hypothetical protein
MRKNAPLLLCLILLSLGMMGNDGCDNSSNRARNSISFDGPVVDKGPVNAVPEPGAALVFGVGLVVVGVAVRRRKSNQ